MSQQINLYSPIFRRQEKKFSALAMLQAGGAIVVVVVLLIGVNLWQVVSLRADLHEVDQQSARSIKQLEEANRQFKPRVGDARLEEEVARYEAILAASSQAQQSLQRDIFSESRGYSAYFIALARQSQAGLWLTGIDIVGAGESMELKGRTHNPERVPQYLQRLSSEKILSGTEFKLFRLERPMEEDKSGTTRPDPRKKPAAAAFVEFTIRTTPVTDTTAKPGTRRP